MSPSHSVPLCLCGEYPRASHEARSYSPQRHRDTEEDGGGLSQEGFLKITEVRVRDIRFPTSLDMDGSDALNLGDYSATYVTVVTDSGLTGDGLTFTNGRGNEIVVAAVHALKHHVIGRRLSEITSNLRGFYRDLTVDKQLRWLGPEKGILHMA